jgi:hypothetical protein
MRTKDLILLESLYEKVVEEAKKKINPWAVCGKVEEAKKKESCVKGVKKSAKKYGKKITSKSVNKKK